MALAIDLGSSNLTKVHKASGLPLQIECLTQTIEGKSIVRYRPLKPHPLLFYRTVWIRTKKEKHFEITSQCAVCLP